jgi:hypothetical protein
MQGPFRRLCLCPAKSISRERRPVLAASAREILSTLGEKLKIDTFLDDVADWKDVPVSEVLKNASRFVSFMKHANRDPTAGYWRVFRTACVCRLLALSGPGSRSNPAYSCMTEIILLR